MSIDARATREAGYLLIKVTGDYSLTSYMGLIDRVAVASEEAGQTNVLVDITDVAGNPPGVDRLDLGKYAAKVWEHRIRVAVVARAEVIDKFFENVAVNRAVRVVVVPDVRMAQAWLLRETPDG